MKIIPMDLKPANEFVTKHHRHNRAVLTHKFSIGLEKNGKLIGVAIAAKPIARALDNGKTLELRRVCVKPRHPNACSKLLGRMKRIGQLMGYEKIITYTLQKESGTSLRAVKARCVATTKPGTWAKRHPNAKHYPIYDEPKYRWELQDQEAA